MLLNVLKKLVFLKHVDCIKKIFKLSLNFLVFSLTDVERERDREGGRKRGQETGEKKEGRESRVRERERERERYTYTFSKMY